MNNLFKTIQIIFLIIFTYEVSVTKEVNYFLENNIPKFFTKKFDGEYAKFEFTSKVQLDSISLQVFGKKGEDFNVVIYEEDFNTGLPYYQKLIYQNSFVKSDDGFEFIKIKFDDFILHSKQIFVGIEDSDESIRLSMDYDEKQHLCYNIDGFPKNLQLLKLGKKSLLANYAYNVGIYYEEIKNDKVSEVLVIQDSKTNNFVLYDINNDLFIDIITNNKILLNNSGEFNKVTTYNNDDFDSSLVFVQPLKDSLSNIIKIYKKNQNEFVIQLYTLDKNLKLLNTQNLLLENGFSNLLNIDIDNDFIDEYFILPSDKKLSKILILQEGKLINSHNLFSDNIFSKFENYNEIRLFENSRDLILIKNDSNSIVYNIRTKKIKEISPNLSLNNILDFYIGSDETISIISPKEIDLREDLNKDIIKNYSLNNFNINYLKIVDLDGDNIEDLFLKDNFICSNYHLILNNNSSGFVKVSSNILDEINLKNFIFADINNDNIKEIIYNEDNNIKILKINYSKVLENDKKIKVDFSGIHELPSKTLISYMNQEQSSYINSFLNQNVKNTNYCSDKNFSLNVSPNPFLQKIQINLTNLDKSEISISLFNTLGAKVIDIYNGFSENSELTLDYAFPSNLLSSDIYVLLVTQNNQTLSQKIIRSF